MITVFGATGNTGSVVAHALLDAGREVRVLVRDAERASALREKGAEVLLGDVTDRASVGRALAGAEGAYLLFPPDLASNDLVARGERIAEHYAAALREHAVRHAVLLSSIAAHEPEGTGPIVITHRGERALATVPGTVFTFLRAAYFMENILMNAHPMRQDGVLPVFGGGETFAFPMVATRDIGEVAARALLEPPAANEIIELSGPGEQSFADAAAEASRILGRAVTATPVPLEAMVPTLTGLGISANVAGLYAEMTAAAAAGKIRFDGAGRSVRGRYGLADVLRSAL